MKPFNEVFSQNEAIGVATSLINDLIDETVTAKCDHEPEDVLIDLTKTCAVEIFNTLDPSFNLAKEFESIVLPTVIPPPVITSSRLTPVEGIQPLNSSVMRMDRNVQRGRKILASSENLRINIRPNPIVKRPPLYTRLSLKEQRLAQQLSGSENVKIVTIDYSKPKPRARKQSFQVKDIGDFTTPEQRPKSNRGRKRKNGDETGAVNPQRRKVIPDSLNLELELKSKAKELVENFKVVDVNQGSNDGDVKVQKKTAYQCSYCHKYLKNARTLGNHIKICPKFRFEVSDFVEKICEKEEDESEPLLDVKGPTCSTPTLQDDAITIQDFLANFKTTPTSAELAEYDESDIKQIKEELDTLVKDFEEGQQLEEVEATEGTPTTRDSIERQLAEMEGMVNIDHGVALPVHVPKLPTTIKDLTEVLEEKIVEKVDEEEKEMQVKGRKRRRGRPMKQKPSKIVVYEDGSRSPVASGTCYIPRKLDVNAVPNSPTANSPRKPTRNVAKAVRRSTRRSLRNCMV